MSGLTFRGAAVLTSAELILMKTTPFTENWLVAPHGRPDGATYTMARGNVRLYEGILVRGGVQV